MYSMRPKRGQITLFIILGIILLFTIGTVLYFTTQQTRAPLQQVVQVPEELQKVYDYVTECIDQTSREGLTLMGAQGGYVTLPTIIARNPNAHLNADLLGVTKTPYWYYEGEDRTPSVDYMQRDLARHVRLNLPFCTGNFDAFAATFNIIPVGEPLPTVTITDDRVLVEVAWPLNINAQGRQLNLNQFIVAHNVQLKKMHDLATKTMDFENKNGWMENLTIDLMSANERIPMSGLQFKCGTQRWHIMTIKDELQNTLYYNLPSIRIENTDYPEPLASMGTYRALKSKAEDLRDDAEAGRNTNYPTDAPQDAFEINRMMIDVGAEKSNLKAAFIYQPDWKMLINAQPSQGGILSTAQMKGNAQYLRFLCMNQYHFAYDVIYPVKFLVKDPTAFNGDGYTFQMAFPVIIEDNEENRRYFGLRRFEIPDVGGEYCQTTSNTVLDVRALGFTEGSVVAEELSGANITYQCINQECVLGETKPSAGYVRLNAFLPEGCSNPTIIAQKDGYLPGKKTTNGGVVDVFMTKLHNVNYSIILHPYYEDVSETNPYQATGAQWIQETGPMPKDRHAVIMISARNYSYDQYKVYPENYAELEGQAGLNFVYNTAQYDIDVLLMKDDTPIGGYHAENITLSYADIANSKEVVFHVVEYRPLPAQPHQQAGLFTFLYDRLPKDQKYATLKPVFR